MRILILVFLLLMFVAPHYVSAAFVVRMDTSNQLRVTDTAKADTLARHHFRGSHAAMQEWATHRWWYQKRGLSAIAAISGVLGIAAIVGFFVVLPVSVPWAIVFAVLTSTFGGVAFSFGEMGLLSAHPHKNASGIGMLLGIIEVIPASILLSVVWLFYDLFRLKRGRNKG